MRKGTIVKKSPQNEYHSMNKIKDGKVNVVNKSMESDNQYGLAPFTSRMKTKSKYSLENEPVSARK